MSRFFSKPLAGCAGAVVVLLAALWAAGRGAEAPPKASGGPAAGEPGYKSPTCIAFSPSGDAAFVTNHTAGTLSIIDTAAGRVVAEIPVGNRPTGVAASADGSSVFVAATGDHSVSFVDPKAMKVVAKVRCGYEPTGLAASADGKRLYTANYISDDVSVIDVPARREIRRIKVGRAPTYLALTRDGKTLVVNNSLSHDAATNTKLTAHVSVVDTAAGKVVARRGSPGTMLLGMGVALSADERQAFCVHARANFNITPSQLNQGWVQTNALSIVPLGAEGRKVVTVLLDNVSSGAANPHGVALSRDGRRLFVSHRGTHQISVVDLRELGELIRRTPPPRMATAHVNLGFLWQQGTVVRRVSCGGLGPNGVAVSPADGSLYVANYFSDQVAVLDEATGKVRRKIDLGGPKTMTLRRRGEFLFHDAVHCFQRWLSCTSCHPGVRADGANWDLLNDGQGNPKNVKSLVGAWQTPPAMATGVRPSMEVAAEKGFLFIQFVRPSPDELSAVRAFLRSVPFIPSPFHRRADGTPDEAARRGEKVFNRAGCASCHPPPLYTDLGMYDVGTHVKRDGPVGKGFDTPTLIELYRTAPYLHDGRAATLEEIFTKFNAADRHGTTSGLSPQELADMAAFLKSL